MISQEQIKTNFPYLTSEQLKKYEQHINTKQPLYLEQIKYIDNQFVAVVFAIKETRLKRENGKIYQQIIFVHNEKGEMLLSDNAYCSTMGGWRTLFPDTLRKNSWYYAYYKYDQTEVLRNYYNNKYPAFVYYALRDYEIQDLYKLDPEVKYCAYHVNMQSMPFVQYISRYRIYKSMEYLSKANIIWAMNDVRFLKRIEKDKEFARYIARNKGQMAGAQYSYVDLLQAYKNDLEPIYANDISVLRNCSGYTKVKHLFNLREVVLKYKDYSMYIDYLKMCVDAEIEHDANIKNRDLEEEHQRVSAILNIRRKYQTEQEKKEMENKFSTALKSWWSVVKWQYKDYLIKLPKSLEELETEGTKLHHCVGTYANRIISGETIIAFMRKKEEPEEPFYTIEIKPETKQITQVRTKYNQPITDEVRSVLSKWKEFELAI